jgi:hypothetical protein
MWDLDGELVEPVWTQDGELSCQDPMLHPSGDWFICRGGGRILYFSIADWSVVRKVDLLPDDPELLEEADHSCLLLPNGRTAGCFRGG